MNMISVAIILFLIMDPVGNVSILLQALKPVPPKKHVWVILREMCFVLIAMLFFYFLGDVLLRVLDISETTVRITSGVILFIAAIKILFPKMGNVRDVLRKEEEPFIVPIAIPLVAGPSLLATIMLFAHLDSLNQIIFPAMIIAWFFATLVLLASKYFYRWMGENGLVACEKVMAMILVLLAIQRFLEGIKLFVSNV